MTGFAPAAGATVAAPGATGAVTPEITGHTCVRNPTWSRILYYSSKQDHLAPACFSNYGYTKIGDGEARFNAYCAGWFSGYLWVNGQKKAFTKGFHSLCNQRVSAISITEANHHSQSCKWTI